MKLVAALAALLVTTAAYAQDPVRLFAAGSLRAALVEAGKDFEAANGVAVSGTFGPSGLLRERIEKGEAAEVFASADMGHPTRLADAGRSGPVALFARNRLCALASPKAGATSANLLDRMLDPAARLGISTPKADPSGDYAWQLFARAESLKAGARAALEAKALKLSGGADSPQPPEGRNVYAWRIERRDADLYLAYCTAALEAKRQVPALEIVQVPEALAVGADYGLVVLKGASIGAERFARYLRSPEGQAVLLRHGFSGGAK